MNKPLAVLLAIISLCGAASATESAPTADAVILSTVQESVSPTAAVTGDASPTAAATGDASQKAAVTGDASQKAAVTGDVLPTAAVTGDVLPTAAVTGDASPTAAATGDASQKAAVTGDVLPTVAATGDASPVIAATADAAALDINAPSVILMEKETGTILYAKDEHTQREPASVTKIMTILLTMEAIDSGVLSYDSVVTASAHAASMGGSQIWLRENEQMTVEEMLKAVCVVSANDCAVALGEHLAGSEEAFVERMNRRAKELGMNDTTFQNATGLPAVGHVTSAYDIALMSRELVRNHPDIRKFTTIWTDSLRGGASVLVNTNKLLRTFDGATGLKTGSTSAARYCLSATAERDGMELIAVILKGETSQKRFQDARTLLNYGFSHYALRSIEPETPLPPISVELGAADSVEITPDGTCLLLLDKDKAAALRQEVTLEETLTAPVERGQRVGTLTAYAGDELVAEIPLLTASDVPRVTYGQMFFRLFRMAFLDE